MSILSVGLFWICRRSRSRLPFYFQSDLVRENSVQKWQNENYCVELYCHGCFSFFRRSFWSENLENLSLWQGKVNFSWKDIYLTYSYRFGDVELHWRFCQAKCSPSVRWVTIVNVRFPPTDQDPFDWNRKMSRSCKVISCQVVDFT